MDDKAKIVFIGGCKTGKTEVIKKIWHVTDFSKIVHNVSDDVPGRGNMEFSVIEMPSVLYTFKSYGYGLKECWFTEENRNIISNADAIVFLIQAKSFGYEKEFCFLSEMFKNCGLKNRQIPFIIGISKIDDLKSEGDEHRKNMISDILNLERYICNLITRYDLDAIFSIDDIIPFSAYEDVYIEQLKEKIWGGVISHTNGSLYDENKPTLVVSGKRGCGKSSTLNALFGLDLPIDRAVACTKYPRVMKAVVKSGEENLEINIVDLPGIAESLKADMKYYPFYKHYIEKADVLLCLNQANVRAYTQDETFYKYLSESGTLNPKTSILIAMNHCDTLFKDKEHLDGIELNTISIDNAILKEKIDDMFEKNYKHFFVKTHPQLSKECVIPISASNNWNIDKLRYSLFLN